MDGLPCKNITTFKNCTYAILTHGFYVFYPLFEDYFFKEVFLENSIFMYG